MGSIDSPPLAPQTGLGAGSTRQGLELFCLSFLALFLELMVIRWAPAAARLVAYYANLMLVSSFLGLGIGAIIGRRRKPLLGWLPILLLISVGALILARYVTLPSTTSESRFYASLPRLWNYASLIFIFLTNATVFIPLGQRIGSLFEALPPLRAYSWDLGGSLAGTLCFGLFSLKQFSPLAGMAFVVVVIALFLPRRKWIWALPALLLVLAGVYRSIDPNAFWSPYYYITVVEGEGAHQTAPLREPRPGLRTMQDPPMYMVAVNHDFYQPHGTMDPKRYSPEKQKPILDGLVAYNLPYFLSPAHRRVLVLGAGGGTDTEVAVMNGAEHVDAVEIDPMLVKLSATFNASAIYENPKVSAHVDDARAFLQRSAGGYDMVVFGWLDSQALFSVMANLRLDGYIYTVESMRSAYRLLNEHGTLSLSFMAGKEWLARKLVRMVAEATGKQPIVYKSRGQVVLCAPRGDHPEPPAKFGRFTRAVFRPGDDLADATSPTDTWPFLYLNGKHIPADYLIVIGILLILCLPGLYMLRGGGFGTNDSHFLFLGLGFLLLETKSITDCSLYFGTTWMVTLIVVTGVLLMVLAANLVAMRLKRFHLGMYVPLIASLLVLYFVKRGSILALSFERRLLWSLLVAPLPIFFAGLIFSTTFREGAKPSAFFGANLIGAMLGGFCEYLSMKIGNENLMLLVVAAYVVSFGCRMRLAGRSSLAPPGA
jgi:hypothetical protein